MLEILKKNLDSIKFRIDKAAQKVGKSIDDIILVGVSKTQPIEKIERVYEYGLRCFGENKVQEAIEKMDKLAPLDIKWHFIGHLQTNKINKVLGKFELIHSVDSLHLAEELNKKSLKRELVTNILIEVNTSGEESKFGFEPETLIDVFADFEKFKNLKILGLMTVALYSDNESEVRKCFITLRELFENLKKYNSDNIEMKYLSMGMSHDFEIAIEEGANIVRIGTAIFGERVY